MPEEVTITLPDNSTIKVDKNATVYDVAGKIGSRLQKEAVAGGKDGDLVDLNYHITENVSLRLFTFKDREGKETYWHSGSHLMAQAVKRMYPSAKLAIGPSIDNGFYYDIDLDKSLSPDDLEQIEKEMTKIVNEDLEIVREDLPRQEAIELFSKLNESYKVELLNEITDDIVSVYRQGEFIDLCKGPHVTRTSQLKAFKLTSLAGAYWRGDENRKMLQRIYGTVWQNEKELKGYLENLKEIERRDHRRLGKELELYSIQDDIGPGLVLWHPKGGYLRNRIETFWREEHLKNGYELVFSPHIGRAQLWQTSGHLDFYSENMYSPIDIDGQQYYVKPMNCPFHLTIYKSRNWSYRELPLRWAELGTVYRYERSGVLHGLPRVRGFTQDDAHIICRPDQMPQEIDRVLEFCMFMLRSFGFNDFKIYLATKPGEKYVGSDEGWTAATSALEDSVKRAGIDYEMDEGGGAFYGPKIDIKINDALGRQWQCSTIQFDFNLSERFDITYIGNDGRKHRPFMIHRALLGSLERFIGLLIEHYAGKFPLWLAPVQVILLNVSDDTADYTSTLKEKLVKKGIRAEADLREETVGYKIRSAVEKKVPYMGVIGKKEMESNTVSLRKRGEKDSATVPEDDFIQMIQQEVTEKAIH